MGEATTMSWERSSFCASGSCVEVAVLDDTVAMRDGKNTDIAALVFTKADWHRFLDRLTADARGLS